MSDLEQGDFKINVGIQTCFEEESDFEECLNDPHPRQASVYFLAIPHTSSKSPERTKLVGV